MHSLMISMQNPQKQQRQLSKEHTHACAYSNGYRAHQNT